MDRDLAANAAAFEQTVRSVIALAETLDPADWEQATECPGWTVRDQVSHIIGIERWLLGEADPEHELPADLPHVRNDMGRALEVAVDVRRSLPGPKLVDELRDVLAQRLAALPHADPEQQVLLPNGRMGTYTRLIMFRAFDCWAHEQDIRRAVGRPGNLDAPAADCAREILAGGIPYVVAKKAGAAPGESVIVEVIGPIAFTVPVVIGDDGRGRVADAPNPAVTLRMDWETYSRLACGRITPDTAEVTTEGDPDLAHRILKAMAITP